MKTLKNEQKTSSNYPSSSYLFKKLTHYFHPDDDFREDHSWGGQSDSRPAVRSASASDFASKRVG